MSNSIVIAIRKPSWLVANKPLVWACLPILLLSLAIIGILILEASEERRFHARVQQMRASGTPVDSPGLAEWTRARTRSEGVVAWSEINIMQRMLTQIRLNSLSNEGVPADVESKLYHGLFLDRKVPEAERLADYLEKLRPLFRSAENAVKLPQPVTQLDRIVGSVTLGIDGVKSELRLELLHALYRRESERATNAMNLLLQISDVRKPNMGSPEFIGDEYYQERRNDYSTITRSLCVDLWDESYIRMLMERLQDVGMLEQRSRSLVIRSRAIGLDEIPRFVEEHELQLQQMEGTRSAFRFFPFPRSFMTGATKNWLLDSCEAFEQVGTGGYSRLDSRANEVDQKYFPKDGRLVYFHVPYSFRDIGPSFHGLVDNENHRRMARTALAVKLFKTEKGEWPKSLAELSEVDFAAGELQTVDGERWGYEVDGDSAYVWRYRIWNQATMFAETREYRIARDLRSMRESLEVISSSELVRIR